VKRLYLFGLLAALMKNFMNGYTNLINRYFGAMDRGTVFILGQIVAAAGIAAGFFAHQVVTVDSISRRNTGTVVQEACSRAIIQWLDTGSSNVMDDLSSRLSLKTLTTAQQVKP
jgi:hypothetical protein